MPDGIWKEEVRPIHTLIDKIKCWIKGWHNKTLFLGGKLILLKHVLGGIPMSLSDADDSFTWTTGVAGHFSIKSAWEAIRFKHPQSASLAVAWCRLVR